MSIVFVKAVLFQTIQFSVSTISMSKAVLLKQFSLAWVNSLDSKTFLYLAIQFSISTQFNSIWPIDKTLSVATTLGQSGPENNGNEGVPCITQISDITGTSTSDCLQSYTGHSLSVSYSSVEKQSVYSTAPADRTRNGMNPVISKYRVSSWADCSL